MRNSYRNIAPFNWFRQSNVRIVVYVLQKIIYTCARGCPYSTISFPFFFIFNFFSFTFYRTHMIFSSFFSSFFLFSRFTYYFLQNVRSTGFFYPDVRFKLKALKTTFGQKTLYTSENFRHSSSQFFMALGSKIKFRKENNLK